jgi:DNA-binding SARP family transcriptional activator/tetratricopeptide (TPR) repeat protein
VAPGMGRKSQAADVSRQTRLSLRIIGRPGLQVGAREAGALRRKSRALLGYLALTETGEETRERLVGLLWSEVDEDRARASLRQALHEIRDVLGQAGFDGVTGDKRALRLDRLRVEVDLWDVFDYAAAGEPHPLLLLSERPMERLLDELDGVDPAFRDWLVTTRRSLTDRLMRLIESAMRDEARPATDRERLARALRNLDPTHEEAVRLLIRAREESGDIGGALNLYKGLWDLLNGEYDVEPSPETQELIAAIKRGRPTGKPAPPSKRPQPGAGETKAAAKGILLRAAPRPPPAQAKRWPKLMVSVARFDSAGTSAEHRHLVERFRRELIACLVRFREWAVHDAALSPAVSASGARAEYVVEASAFDTGNDMLRLIMTLRDLATGTCLWSERLHVTVASWFEAQQLMVRRTTSAINMHLAAERLVSVAHRPPTDLKAYDAWLLGQATFLSFDPKSRETARSLFRQVIAQMPSFAPAYSSLAQLNNTDHIVRPGVFRDDARTQQALVYAREAARLDPIDSRSQLCLGWSFAMVKQYDQAAATLSRAYDLNENDPWTLISAATCLAFCAHYERAQDIGDQALRLSAIPSPSQWAYHATLRFMQADYAGVIEAATCAGDTNANVAGFKTSALFHLGHREAATAELRQFFQLVRSRWVGPEPASEHNIARWFLTTFPIKRSEDWHRLRDGLVGAGAPAEGLAHHKW